MILMLACLCVFMSLHYTQAYELESASDAMEAVGSNDASILRQVRPHAAEIRRGHVVRRPRINC